MHDFPAPDIWLPHRVSYGETDTMGFLYYAEYLHLFERARSAYIRQCGMSYAEIEARGILLPVREATCRYRSPARYDDLLLIRIAIGEWGRASLRFVYEITASDKKKILASGMTQHALIDRSGRPLGVPDWFREVIGQLKQPAEGEPLY
ncbi:MAG: acyl-CoA thioesterase [Desulfovibrio sp.]|nr:acyl-CoA thioesterase [Desulfovibrio sp.]